MRLVADLHVHSRWSRATSRKADLAGYEGWARIKGIDIVGTGDFTHPRWMDELAAQLTEKDGLYVLKERGAGSPLAGAAPADRLVRFLPTAEISSIYKKHGRVRKVHSIVGVPTLEDARRLGARLARIGNVSSDGRPILGLDPKDLLSIILETTDEGFLIPAHIWTPWFSLFGSKSGFDTIQECFEELTPRIFALETGLSSDPPMNRRWSALDDFRLVSNSDAHSPPNLGREATILDADPSWDGVIRALRTGNGFRGTVEFFPEEGKYHFDGHRACGVSQDPERTRASGGLCPVCGRPLTVGVLNRVLELADRPPPQARDGYQSLIPLPELLAELAGAGAGSLAVQAAYARLISAFGSEYALLLDAPLEEIGRAQGPLLAEAVRRMREGRIHPRPGSDGEFGVIRVFDEMELNRLRGQDELFSAPSRRGSAPEQSPVTPRAAQPRAAAPARESDAGTLDPAQAEILASPDRCMLVHAGPGAGKTRLLVRWVREAAVARAPAGSTVLALAFTNRAAGEMQERLAKLPEAHGTGVLATTFHSFSWMILREHDPALSTVITPPDRMVLLKTLRPGDGKDQIRRLSRRMERAWEGMETADDELRGTVAAYEKHARRMGGVDVSALVGRLVSLLGSDAQARHLVQDRYPVVAVDEMQDINAPQWELLRMLCARARGVLAIGDPDQAIFGFRGSDRRLLLLFREETGASLHGLGSNYRSAAVIVRAASAVIAPDRAPESPPLVAMRPEGRKILVAPTADPAAEGRFIASKILDLVGGVDSLSSDAKRARQEGGIAFSDIAVLFRTRAVRDALLPALAASGIPLSTRETISIVDEEPIRSMIAALRLAANPDDFIARSILDARRLAEPVRERSREIASVAGDQGIRAALDLISPGIVPVDRSDAAIALAEDSLRGIASEHGTDLRGLLVRLSLCAREGEGPLSGESVSLLTFHAAKGLEFPVVFLAGVEEGITPMPDDLPEERRLFYVALTRARDQVVITHCARRRSHGQSRDAVPSRFLSDIPPELRDEQRARPVPRGRQLSLFSD